MLIITEDCCRQYDTDNIRCVELLKDESRNYFALRIEVIGGDSSIEFEKLEGAENAYKQVITALMSPTKKLSVDLRGVE